MDVDKSVESDLEDQLLNFHDLDIGDFSSNSEVNNNRVERSSPVISEGRENIQLREALSASREPPRRFRSSNSRANNDHEDGPNPRIPGERRENIHPREAPGPFRVPPQRRSFPRRHELHENRSTHVPCHRESRSQHASSQRPVQHADERYRRK